MPVEFNDDSKMPFGVHKGKIMSDVPDNYLVWFWNENKEQYLNDEKLPETTKGIMAYIEDNCDSIDIDE